MMNTKQLQSWLNGLKSIPKPHKWERSLMDITGVTHHENMWSDIYKFFFHEEENHHLNDLFIRSLEQLLGREDFLRDFSVKRECVVDEDKRIDLLLYNESTRNAIIIENKVNHSLDNDLNLYQNSVYKMLGQGCCVITVVLGLHHYDLLNYDKASEIAPENKNSITHKELLDKVYENISPYLKDAQTNYIFLLNEFYKNICNMANQIDVSILDFFSKTGNSQRIAEIHKVYTHIMDYVSGILECSEPSELKKNLDSMGMSCKSERGYVKYFFPNTNNQVMLTIFFRDRIFSTKYAPHIHMVFEVQGNAKAKLDAMEEQVADIISKYSKEGIVIGYRRNEKRNKWRHLASQTIHFKNIQEEMPKLGEIAGEYINASSPIIRMGKEIMNLVK